MLHCCVTTLYRSQRFLAACPAATLTGAALYCRVRTCARFDSWVCSADRPGQRAQLGRRGCGHGASGGQAAALNMAAEGLSLRKAPPYPTVCFAGTRPSFDAVLASFDIPCHAAARTFSAKTWLAAFSCALSPADPLCAHPRRQRGPPDCRGRDLLVCWRPHGGELNACCLLVVYTQQDGCIIYLAAIAAPLEFLHCRSQCMLWQTLVAPWSAVMF